MDDCIVNVHNKVYHKTSLCNDSSFTCRSAPACSNLYLLKYKCRHHQLSYSFVYLLANIPLSECIDPRVVCKRV